MISFMDKPYTDEETFGVLVPLVREWFVKKFGEFSPPQKFSIMNIHHKENTLISSPTGSGKTLSAFAAILNELIRLSGHGQLENRIYCLYISPLKALANDIEKNLNEPLEEIKRLAEEKIKGSSEKINIKVSIRTGDTSASERASMLKKTPHIMITTPESFAIMLASQKFREKLKDIDWVIIDEIHAIAGGKRGTQLSLCLERLAYYTNKHLTRIGLSATVSPLEKIASFLVGMQDYNLEQPRDCKIIDVQAIKRLDLKVLSPVPNLIESDYQHTHEEMYTLLDRLIQDHKTTLIFTNTRSATERVVHHLKDKFPKNYVKLNEEQYRTTKDAKDAEDFREIEARSYIGAHHSSLSKEHRLNIENRLKEGKLKCVVCLEGNTEVLESNGKWTKIKDIKETKVKSLSDNMKLGDHDIKTKIAKQNTDKLLKITTSLGKEISCTYEHKFLTVDKYGNTVWIEAKNLKRADYLATIRNYTFKEFTKEQLNKLAYDNYPDIGYINPSESLLQNIKKRIILKNKKLKIYWNKNLIKEIDYSTFTRELSDEFLIRIDVFKKMCYDCNLKFNYIWNNISGISSTKYISPKIELNKDFMRILGFMTAEGYISRTTLYAANKDQIVLNYYYELIEKLSGKKPVIKNAESGVNTLLWESVFLSKFLQNLGFIKGRKSRLNTIPEFVFHLSSEYLFSYLSGYLDGDGFHETKKDKQTYALGYCTSSKQMAKDLSKLLLREGIVSSVRSKYIHKNYQLLNNRFIKKAGWFYEVVILGGDHLKTFSRKITPVRPNLITAINSLSPYGHCNADTIPNLGIKLRESRKMFGVTSYKLHKDFGLDPIKYELNYRSISRTQLNRILSVYNKKDDFLQNLADSDIFWENVKKIEEVEATDFVYNIEVEYDHNYIANGIVTKNCSTSLELGIDIGFIDLVILLGSPKSVSRALQRIGRSAHALHGTIKGRIIVLDRDDLVECSVLLKAAIDKKIDKVDIPENCLDILAQEIYGMSIEESRHIDVIYDIVRKAYPYRNLKKSEFIEVIRYLNGQYISLEDRNVYAKIWFDEETGMIGKKGKMARVLYLTNVGTIPEESHVRVKLASANPLEEKGTVIGKIDENFLEKLKRGDVFVLGGNTYEYLYSQGMTAFVKSSINRPPTVPSWISETLPLSYDLALEIGKFRRYMKEHFENNEGKHELMDFIHKYLYVDEYGANAIYEYFYEQFNFSKIPHDKLIVIEYFSEEEKKYILFHTLFGRRVNDVLSRVLGYIISRLQHKDVEININDNGFYIRTDQNIQASKAFKLIKAQDMRKIAELSLEKSEVLQRRFRHCATRSLMILRNYMGKSKSVSRQQLSSRLLISSVRRISEEFPILKEAKREVLEDLMDIKNAQDIISQIESGRIKIEEVSCEMPSPFAFNIITMGYQDIMKMEDKLAFLKRMHSLVRAKISLKEKRQEATSERNVVNNDINDTSFNYDAFWKDQEDEVQKQKDDRLENLKTLAWSLKNTPYPVREHIVEIIEGTKKIRQDFIEAMRIYKKEIEDNWPRELREFILNRLQELGELQRE